MREWLADRLEALAERVRPRRPEPTDEQIRELWHQHKQALAQMVEHGGR